MESFFGLENPSPYLKKTCVKVQDHELICLSFTPWKKRVQTFSASPYLGSGFPFPPSEKSQHSAGKIGKLGK